MTLLLHAPSAGAAGVVRIGGSGTGLGTVKRLAAAFEKSHPGTKVKVLPSLGSSGGIKAVAAGSIDIGLSIRRLKEDERRQGLQERSYARAPFVLAAHRDVTADDVSTRELIEILNGTRTAWPDGRRIRLVLRPPTDQEILVVKAISGDVARALDAALRRPGMLTGNTAEESASLIERTPGALGFSNLGHLLSDGKRVKILSFNGTAPTVKNTAAGAYPLAVDQYFIMGPNPSEAARSFIKYVFSPAGKRVLEETGHQALAGGP